MNNIKDTVLLGDDELEYCGLQDPITCQHCMKRVAKAQAKKLLDYIGENFAEVVWNFYITDVKGTERTIDLWQQIKKQLKKEVME